MFTVRHQAPGAETNSATIPSADRAIILVTMSLLQAWIIRGIANACQPRRQLHEQSEQRGVFGLLPVVCRNRIAGADRFGATRSVDGGYFRPEPGMFEARQDTVDYLNKRGS